MSWKPRDTLNELGIFNRMSGSDHTSSPRFMAWAPGKSAPVTLNPVREMVMPTHDWWTARLGLFDFEEAYRWGVRYFMPWIPYGQEAGDFYPFDGLVRAREQRLTWLSDDDQFHHAWAKWLEAHTDAHVHFYLGHCFSNTTIGKLSGARWFDRAWRSVQQINALQSAYADQVSFGVDSSNGFAPSTELYRFRRDFPFACEAMPIVEQPGWAYADTDTTLEWFRGRASNGTVHDSELGEVNVLIQSAMSIEDLNKQLAERLTNGRTVRYVYAGIDQLMKDGVKLSELNCTTRRPRP